MKRSIVWLGLLLTVTRLFAAPIDDFKKALRESQFARAAKMYHTVPEKEALRALFEVDPLGIPVKEAVMFLEPLGKIKHEVYAQLIVSPSWQRWLRTNIPELDFVIVSASGTETPPPSESDGGIPGAPEAPEAPEAPQAPDEPTPAPTAGGTMPANRLKDAIQKVESAPSASAAYTAFKEVGAAIRKQLYVTLLGKYTLNEFKPSEKAELISSFFANVPDVDAQIAAIKARKPANAAELEKTQGQAAMASELAERLKGGGRAGGRKSTTVGAVTQTDKEKVKAGLYDYAAAKKAWLTADWKKTVAAFQNFERAADKNAIRKDVYKEIVQEMTNDSRSKWATIPAEYKKDLEAIVTNAGVEIPRLLIAPKPTAGKPVPPPVPPLPAGKKQAPPLPPMPGGK